MLKQENRLRTNFEFNVVRKYGKVLETQYARITYVKPTNYEGPSKLGVVVSTKFDKRATQRNRAKRLVTEVFRLHWKQIPDDLWIAIYPKFSIKEKTYEEISSEIIKAIQKISLPH